MQAKLSPEEYLERSAINRIHQLLIRFIVNQVHGLLLCSRHGVTAYVKDMITVLLENRPEKPLEFISDYLANALQVIKWWTSVIQKGKGQDPLIELSQSNESAVDLLRRLNK
jgi:hypothetical protein